MVRLQKPIQISKQPASLEFICSVVAPGISLKDHTAVGINPLHFSELLMVNGLVLDDRVKWVSIYSGYDFAYLL